MFQGKRKGYKKILVWGRSKVRVYKVSIQEENKDALENETELDKNIAELGDINELAYENLILSALGRLHLVWSDVQKFGVSQG